MLRSLFLNLAENKKLLRRPHKVRRIDNLATVESELEIKSWYRRRISNFHINLFFFFFLCISAPSTKPIYLISIITILFLLLSVLQHFSVSFFFLFIFIQFEYDQSTENGADKMIVIVSLRCVGGWESKQLLYYTNLDQLPNDFLPRHFSIIQYSIVDSMRMHWLCLRLDLCCCCCCCLFALFRYFRYNFVLFFGFVLFAG